MRNGLHLDGSYAPWKWAALGGLALVVGTTAVLFTSRPVLALTAASGAALVAFVVLSIRRPLLYVTVFLVVLILFPPIFHPGFGETPIYVSTFLLPVGLAVLVGRFPDFGFHLDPVAKGLLAFLLATGLSLPFGFWLSGMSVGIVSLLRWLLLTQAALIYVLARGDGA